MTQTREATPRSSLLLQYLQNLGGSAPSTGAAAYYAALDQVSAVSPSIASSIIRELRDQRENIKLIASENYSSLAVQLAHANLLTDKYAEGFPRHRFYAGCDNVDIIEEEAATLARELFGAEHAYVQPHSGADANLVAFAAILSAKVQEPLVAQLGNGNPAKIPPEAWERVRAAASSQRLLAMDYYSGGHLSHGYRFNYSSIMFEVQTYSVDQTTGLVDLDRLNEQVRQFKPLILLAGYSAYPRRLNFAKLREMADEVGAIFMVDMAHFAGLVAGRVFTGDYDPIPYAHIVTSTTHKTLRGPRGGMVLCKNEFAEWINKGCPMILGGPLPHAIAAKAIALREANTQAFREYAARIVDNARALAEALAIEGIKVATGGTDNHIVLIDVYSTFGLTGRQAESALRRCGLTLNRNSLPFDPNGPWYTSGLRLGTPAVTTLGMGTNEMQEIARIISKVLTHVQPTNIDTGPQLGQTSKAHFSLDATLEKEARTCVGEILHSYPLYPELDLDLLLSVPYPETTAGAPTE